MKNKIEISANYDLLKSYLSEKISLIVNSTVFIDYLRSGPSSRRYLKSDFVYNIRSSKLKEITGMTIETVEGEKIFFDGISSDYYITMPLCYLDRGVDSKLGACLHQLILYFDKNEIVKSLIRINDKLINCNNCEPINFSSNKNFGSFYVIKSSMIPLFLDVKYQQSFDIITINLIVIIIMIILASINWRRTNYILVKYLSDPLNDITNKLKNGDEFYSCYKVDELKYLADQIQDRETKLNQAKENENLVVIGKIASQFAHDIRSPLAIINSIIDNSDEIPNEKRMLIHNVTQHANAIANSLLSQYRTELANQSLHVQNNITNTIAELLGLIVLEKKIQYEHLPIEIIEHYTKNDRSIINKNHVTDFKRVISNIINNSIESIDGSGSVTVQLNSFSRIAIINITDTGIGMKKELINMISSGKSISNKRYGAGIGLVSAIKQIQSWGGNLEIFSRVDIGTSIIITIPVTSPNSSMCNISIEFPDLILIDDNTIVLDAWKFYATHNNKKIVVFSNIEDANDKIERFDRNTKIYIDSDLGASIRGEQYAKYLYEMGFTNIFLTTGFTDSAFPYMPWIKSIIDKNPAVMCL